MALHIDCEGFARRDFLRAGSLALGGLSLGSYLRMASAGEVNSAAKAKAAIFINLRGGPSHMDMFDPKPESASEYRGEFNTIPTGVAGVHFSEHLPLMAACTDKYALLRGVTHTLAAHELGTLYVNTGNRPLPSLEFPGYGSVVTKELGGPKDLPPFVAIPNTAQRAGYLGVKYAPLSTSTSPKFGQPYQVRGVSLRNGLTVTDIERRNNLRDRLDTTFAAYEKQDQLLEGLDRFSEQALSVITSPRAREAFDISKEPESFSKQFGSSDFGASCLLGLRLVESGVRFVTISSNGWDTHQNNWESLKTKQLPPLDQGLSGLLNGLEQRGLLESTVVYVTGEFGRTPKINTTRGGRDHYPRCMFMILAGGGIKGGQVLGESDATASGPKNDGFTPDDVAATFFHTLGIDHHKEYHTNTGRPVMIVRDGKVIQPLFA